MMWDTSAFLGALTPKFYVALTGTSSLISGLILIFEWWYFRKYGTSFIEQVSLTHLSPWLGGGSESEREREPSNSNTNGNNSGECKVYRNPMSLLRGAEYARLWVATGQPPLTYYDMNLTAQEHQAWFGLDSEATNADPAEAALARAWRERAPEARVAAARDALRLNPELAPALLLLAEEHAPTVTEAERILRRAWRAAEAAWRAAGGAGGAGGEAARRGAAVLAHVKRRAAMCARRLGRLRDAARLFRDLTRDAPPALHALAPHENLIEVLLEQKLFAEASGVVARYEESGALSAALLYTAALLRARAGAPLPDVAAAMRRAIEFNAHVPPYLLELRALAAPPEHVLRRGESEALAYAAAHLPHWRAAPAALQHLSAACQAAERVAWPAGYGGACAACADRELLRRGSSAGPAAGPVAAAAGGGRGGALLPAAAVLCAVSAALALAAHRWPAALDPRPRPARLLAPPPAAPPV